MRRGWILYLMFVGGVLFLSSLRLLGDDKKKDFIFYINALEKIKDKKFQVVLIHQIHEYLDTFPEARGNDEMEFKLAKLYELENDLTAEFYTLLKIIYLYPNSQYYTQAKDKLRTLTIKEKQFSPFKENVEKLLAPAIPDTSRETALFTFITDMVTYNFNPFNPFLLRTCNRFLRNYPESVHNAKVQFWKAELLYRDKKYREALAEYMKVNYLYDGSIYVAPSKLRIADIFTEELNLHQKAILTLEEFLVEFPEDPQAAFAQMRTAQILEKKLKKPLDALNTYLAVAEKYPKSLEAVPSLFEAARIYEKKFKEYEKAVEVYLKVVNDFSTDLKAPFALAEAGRIYEDQLKNYSKAAEIYEQIFEKYPKSDLAARYLYKAAEIYEKKLSKLEQALTLYRKVVDNYSNSDIAKKASKKIEKLSEKMEKAEKK